MEKMINQGTNSATSEDWLTVTQHAGIRISDSQMASPFVADNVDLRSTTIENGVTTLSAH
jgi:hypothetical protein